MLKTLLVLLLTVSRESSPTAACSSSCSSDCDCSNRGLSSVPQDLSRNITKLNLEGNSITSLSQSDFSKYTKLVDLLLQKNQISIINPGTFSNMADLICVDLHSNKLSNILPGTFKNIPKLRMLWLYYNPLPDIKSGTFSDLPELTSMQLVGNQMRSIHPDIFLNVPKLKTLYMWDNPWHCDCRMKPVRKRITETKSPFKKQITCQEPSNVRGKQLDRINLEDLICQKPKIVSFNNNKAQGETLYLSCEALGVPPPSVIVTLPSGRIATAESSGMVTVAVNGTVTITNITVTDAAAGQYICIASNPVGSASATDVASYKAGQTLEEKAVAASHVSHGCPLGYTLHDPVNACFKAYSQAKTYHQARDVCAADGGLLAMPKTSSLNNFVMNLMNELDPGAEYWLGLNDLGTEGEEEEALVMTPV
ncbi:PREDICTED: leucine-rich repeat-containing protein 15-like [Branchiostoma belcheri]|uniref:Leucine-rich repeat-containing protein 15-like n=1 Tax=Branchiostoma belcheri TaxID=7741 RepID=A0A6P4Z2J8_BRABE|nr:PREDICTED: leucine-rich repeat-containing protein 15-like [Branchiostoma belcheri]